MNDDAQSQYFVLVTFAREYPPQAGKQWSNLSRSWVPNIIGTQLLAIRHSQYPSNWWYPGCYPIMIGYTEYQPTIKVHHEALVAHHTGNYLQSLTCALINQQATDFKWKSVYNCIS